MSRADQPPSQAGCVDKATWNSIRGVLRQNVNDAAIAHSKAFLYWVRANHLAATG
jgi:hypothetical protein